MQTATNNISRQDFAATCKHWNEANAATRKRLLVDAGYSSNSLYARAFNYLPSNVREDVIYAYQRSTVKQPADHQVHAAATT